MFAFADMPFLRADPLVPVLFACAASAYGWVAVRLYRSGREPGANIAALFSFLLGTMILGSAFAYAAADATLYSIGFVLRFFSDGFLPVVLYLLYRHYTASRPHAAVVTALCVVPVTTTILALTNPLHHLLWSLSGGADGRFPTIADALWITRVHAPFTWLLTAYSILALAARLPTIGRAHHKKLWMLLACATLPYVPSIAVRLFGTPPFDFPVTSLILAVALPAYAWVALKLRIFDVDPVSYQTVLHHLRDPIVVLDGERRIVGSNRAAMELFGRPERDVVGRALPDLLPEAASVLDEDGGCLTQTVRIRADRWFELTSTPLTASAGRDQGVVVVCRDVTERLQTLRALADSEQLIRSLIENSSNGMLRFSCDGEATRARFRCIFANRAAEGFLDSGSGTLVGMPLEKLELLEPGKLAEHFGAAHSAGSSISYETPVESDEGEVWLRVVGEPVGRDFSVTLIDITQRKRAEAKILADALRDPLTGVLNRRGFEAEAAATIAGVEHGAVLYLDLNHFKAINDRFGHQAGDALLKAFGHRLEFCLRPEDVLARLGGDEFAIVLPGVSVEDAKHVAVRLVETASEAYIIQGQEICCAASVGIALMPAHGQELWQLVAVADQAMYRAKANQDEAAGDRAAYVEAAIAS